MSSVVICGRAQRRQVELAASAVRLTATRGKLDEREAAGGEAYRRRRGVHGLNKHALGAKQVLHDEERVAAARSGACAMKNESSAAHGPACCMQRAPHAAPDMQYPSLRAPKASTANPLV
eukprot:TRINITY_DN67_c0_g1_i1.p2 TRINITY_DN67_c0_g1~~TRINITY_DN67_c0_g1_i1.p2  ORF type:complete len:120 (-),score=10.54 TRINITY_DN67_c0_g1_i1:1715-2074(-)